jgi:serine/threonine-protein kinase
MDFGLSKLARPDGGQPALTRAGHVMGTPAFMSPEQVRDVSTVGPPSDVYSLGLVLFELLTGRSPYDAQTVSAFCAAHLFQVPLDLHAVLGRVPPALSELTSACLAKEPDGRPRAKEVERVLSALADEAGAPAAEGVTESSFAETAPG